MMYWCFLRQHCVCTLLKRFQFVLWGVLDLVFLADWMQMPMVMTEVFPSAVQRASWGRLGCVARMTQCEGRKESKGLIPFCRHVICHSAGCANLSYCFGLCSGGLSHPKKSSRDSEYFTDQFLSLSCYGRDLSKTGLLLSLDSWSLCGNCIQHCTIFMGLRVLLTCVSGEQVITSTSHSWFCGFDLWGLWEEMRHIP